MSVIKKVKLPDNTVVGINDDRIDLVSPQNGQVITYNSSTSKLENSTPNPKLTAVLSYTEIPPESEGDEPTLQLGCSESISTIISTITNGGYNAVQFFMNAEGNRFPLNLVSIENNAIGLIGTGVDTSDDVAELTIVGISENDTDTWYVEGSWNSVSQSLAVKDFLENYDPSVVPVQSDWDEGDSSKMSFVKNRTHYVDYFNRNEYTNPCTYYTKNQYQSKFVFNNQNPQFANNYTSILDYLSEVYGSPRNYNCFNTYLNFIASLSINNISLFTNYATIHTLSNDFLTELEQIDQSLADNLNSLKYYIGNIRTYINVQFLRGAITSQVKDSATSLIEQYQTDNDNDVDFTIILSSPYYYTGFNFITDNSINNYDLLNNPAWEVVVGIPQIVKLPLSFLPLPRSTGAVDNRKKLIMLNGEYVLSEDYAFTHTQYQATYDTTNVITYAANTRGSGTMLASANLRVAFNVNNNSDNYLWITNIENSDIRVTLDSITHNNSPVYRVIMLNGDIVIPKHSTCQICIVCNADGAYISSSYDMPEWTKAPTKPTYDPQEVGAIPITYKGANNGVAELDSSGKVPSSQLPSYVDDVVNGYLYNGVFYKDSAHTTAITPESDKIYVELATNKTYRWSGSVYVEISESLALGETSSTAYAGNKGKANADEIAAIKDGTTIDSFGDVETTLAAITSQLSEVDEKATNLFIIKQWNGSWPNGIAIPSCTTDVSNTSIDKMVFSISNEEGVTHQVVGLIAYEVFDAVTGGNRLNVWPVCQFTGNGQKELHVRWTGMGPSTKYAKRIAAWVLLKHR